jgi:hypothetical protein
MTHCMSCGSPIYGKAERRLWLVGDNRQYVLLHPECADDAADDRVVLALATIVGIIVIVSCFLSPILTSSYFVIR